MLIQKSEMTKERLTAIALYSIDSATAIDTCFVDVDMSAWGAEITALERLPPVEQLKIAYEAIKQLIKALE